MLSTVRADIINGAYPFQLINPVRLEPFLAEVGVRESYGVTQESVDMMTFPRRVSFTDVEVRDVWSMFAHESFKGSTGRPLREFSGKGSGEEFLPWSESIYPCS